MHDLLNLHDYVHILMLVLRGRMFSRGRVLLHSKTSSFEILEIFLRLGSKDTKTDRLGQNGPWWWSWCYALNLRNCLLKYALRISTTTGQNGPFRALRLVSLPVVIALEFSKIPAKIKSLDFSNTSIRELQNGPFCSKRPVLLLVLPSPVLTNFIFN